MDLLWVEEISLAMALKMRIKKPSDNNAEINVICIHPFVIDERSERLYNYDIRPFEVCGYKQSGTYRG